MSRVDHDTIADIVKAKVLPVLLILAIVGLFIFFSMDATRSLAPTSTEIQADKNFMDPSYTGKQMDAIIAHSDGNWDHLSPEEQQIFNSASAGHGKKSFYATLQGDKRRAAQKKSVLRKKSASDSSHP